MFQKLMFNSGKHCIKSWMTNNSRWKDKRRLTVVVALKYVSKFWCSCFQKMELNSPPLKCCPYLGTLFWWTRYVGVTACKFWDWKLCLFVSFGSLWQKEASCHKEDIKQPRDRSAWQGTKWKVKVLVIQVCRTVAYQVPLSMAGILEWVAIPFSRGSFRPRDWTPVSCIADGVFTTEPPGKPKELSFLSKAKSHLNKSS